jgi:hypothetical protein
MQAVQTKLLRAVMGKTKRDRIRNAHIREELRMEDIWDQIKGNRLRWFGHVKRMDEHRIPNRLLEMKMTGRTQGQTTNILARPSQKRHRKKRTILGED